MGHKNVKISITQLHSFLIGLSPRYCSERVFFFFFQAEDGIRDYKVTGVQTCALPISSCGRRSGRKARRSRSSSAFRTSTRSSRSEERRVGKECRSRWSPYH